jgi:chemotaxis signal transduction protein
MIAAVTGGLPHGLAHDGQAGPDVAVPSPGMAGVADITSELLVFRVGGEQFAMSVEAVEGISVMPPITPLPAMPDNQLGVCDLRGSLIPVYSPSAALNVRLGTPAVAMIAWAGRTRLSPGRRVVIAVDEASGVTAIHERGWGDIGGTPCTEGFVRGVSASGAELTTLLHASGFLAACTASPDDHHEETR